MKKLIALILVLSMMAAFAACGTADKENNKGSTEQTTEGTEEGAFTKEANEANDIMTDVWSAIPADQKPVVIGGHYSNQYTEGPATYDLAYVDELGGTLLIPDDQLAYVTDASTAIHMMNANSMTIGIVKLSEGADQQAFADAVYNTITNNQWMCGFPEKLIISQVHGEYMLIAYGLTELLDTFDTTLSESWKTVDFYNEAIG